MDKIKIRVIVIGFVLCLFVGTQIAFAAAGGGGADYGGGGGGGGYNNNFDGGSRRYRNHTSLDGGSAILIGIVGVVAFVFNYVGKSSNHPSETTPKSINVDRNIRNKMDMTFDEANYLLEKVKICFIEIQNAWSKQDLMQADQYYSADLYREHQLLLYEMAEKSRINIVKDVIIEGFYEYNKYDDARFRIGVHASLIDYTISTNTGQTISGYTNRRGTISQVWEFEIMPEGHVRANKIITQ